MTFLELAERVLLEQKKSMTANEIWQVATDMGLVKKLNSGGKTPWATLSAQIYVNAKDSPKSLFAQTDSRPIKFYLKSQESQIDFTEESVIDEEEEEERTKQKKFDFKELDLHKILTYYAYHYFHCVTKTINHSKSTKKEYGEWVHPDMVGCYFPIDDWKPEVYDLSSSIGNVSIKLFSFELKRELTWSSLRESFFQTVSNSTWANESYLVTAEIYRDTDFIEELRRLSSAFGIGVIKLNLIDPDSSEIIMTSKYREVLDWETINKLVGLNPDIKEFISTVKIDVQSKKIHKKEYDEVLKLNP